MEASELKEYFAHDEFAKSNGIVIENITDDRAIVAFTVKENHLNAGGACQGGAIFTLADFAVAIVGNQMAKCVSVNVSINFMRSAKLGDKLTAVARIAANHKKLPTAEAIVSNQRGEVVAVAQAMMYCKS